MRSVRTTIFWLLAILPAAVGHGQTVLYDFYADWCPACRAMSATVEQLSSHGYAVERIDVDREPALARQYAVTSIPCFVVVERGKEIDRTVGQTTIERLKLKMTRRKNAGVPIDVRHQDPPERRPHPAWRYEQPVGHRAAVVRIFCQNTMQTHSIGSGTLVRWGAKKIVVLTARHVVADAKKIVVELFNKKTYTAWVLKVDAVWDCAVLQLDGSVENLKPAEVELGDDAMQHEGNRLESCGYGPDGKLAANTGLFLGYRRSTQTPNGPDDWFEISGHARPGDSGGGIFNNRGRLVGVLWGTNGEVVVGVQAGRLHLLLDSALPPTVPILAPAKMGLSALPSPTSYVQRNPTPPKCDSASGCCPVPGPIPDEPIAENTSAKKSGSAVLPWRGKSQQRDEQLDVRTRDLLDTIEAERQARLAAEAATRATEQPKTEPKEAATSPLLAGLCILAAVAAGFVIYFAAASKN
jgi:S1-C subfamily serine protease